ncbi:MAG TPA: DUF3450 domain-containing protein [Myxococcota bacterium]|nr:DUF3450 domain-containing protein [Myxococcota bacterium]
MKLLRAGRGLMLWPLLVVILTTWPAGADDLNKTIDLIMKSNKATAESQARIDKISEDTGDLLGQYRAVLEQIESIRSYNAQVETLIASQRGEISALENQIENATSIGREATPLMLRMIDALDAFIKLDVPFLKEERAKRVADLKEMMNRADVAESEKYRRILEAYQIENEFGRTIEAYKGELAMKGKKQRTVNFLRVGRVALAYLTLDEKEAGLWNKDTKSWEELPGEYRSSIKKGLRIARKQTAPDLIRIPVFAAEDAK